LESLIVKVVPSAFKVIDLFVSCPGETGPKNKNLGSALSFIKLLGFGL
jgi:hypothetical protein